MATAFGRHLSVVKQWLAEHQQMEVLLCETTPLSCATRSPQATRSRPFIALPLDVRQMASVVDERLYRQRIS